MLRPFEDFVNRPANDKIVYHQEKKMTRSENSLVRLALKFHLLFDYYPRTHPLIFLLNKVISKDLGRPNHRGVSHFYALFRTAVWVILCPLRVAKEGLTQGQRLNLTALRHNHLN